MPEAINHSSGAARRCTQVLAILAAACVAGPWSSAWAQRSGFSLSNPSTEAPAPVAPPAGGAAGTIGVNKYDLFAQYTGTASGGDGSPAFRRVTLAMARKALADAQDAGVRYMRVSMSGRTSTADDAEGDSLELWVKDPAAFWRQVDEMMKDLDHYGIQIIPVLNWGTSKFPQMTGEGVRQLFTDPRSRSWQLLERFVTEFVMRYRGRGTVLFYELTNELNNYADLDTVRRCKNKARGCLDQDRFSTADMLAYTSRLATLVHRLDGSRQVSSGFTIPRPAAEHLRARPEWVTGRPDWTRDTREEFARNLRDIHAQVDIISIHLYGGEPNKRYGSSDPVDMLTEAKRAADRIGKPLFVGEFGDREAAAETEREAAGLQDRGRMSLSAGSHALRMIRKIQQLRVPYSAIWVWELYQNKTYVTQDNRHTSFSLEPGYTDDIIDLLRQVNGAPHRAGARDATAPRVVLTWPLPCAAVRPGMDVHAVASDDSGKVAKVEFLLDDQVIEQDASVPYQAKLAGTLAAGKHRLSARAYDLAGNVSEFSSHVVVGRAAAAQCSVEAGAR